MGHDEFEKKDALLFQRIPLLIASIGNRKSKSTKFFFYRIQNLFWSGRSFSFEDGTVC